MEEDDAMTVLPCWHCDFASGMRGMDRCSKCGGTGSLLWVSGRAYPNTVDGWKRAKSAQKADNQ